MVHNSSNEFWFWQLIVSPHMADLAVVLARRGCKVTYVVQQQMSVDRVQQGWSVPSLPGVVLELADNDAAVHRLVKLAAPDSVHICQGVRSNGMVRSAQLALEARGLRQWVVMETVDDSGWRGVLRRAEYTRIFRTRGQSLQGVLAIGHLTADWVAARGMPADRVYPFAYFLPIDKSPVANLQRTPGLFRFIFAGQLIPRKRVDWLINALASLKDQAFELWIVGAGPEEIALRDLATIKLGTRVRWLGQLPLPDVPIVIAQADCLVLPSVHDGWGAVASEALMVGTPVVCSNSCGVAEVVKMSDVGGVFTVNDSMTLQNLLAAQIAQGIVMDDVRTRVKEWASCLGSDVGVDYLQKILISMTHQQRHHIKAPWICLN